VLRFVASVMIVSGALLIADAAATLAWQEPVSALLAEREQSRLDGQLDRARDLAARDRREQPGEPDLAALAARQRRRTKEGDAVGRIGLPELGRSYAIVEGTESAPLRKGPGHYPDTPLPGERGTVGVAGHRTTYGAPFRTIDRLERGDEIVMDMPYGRFVYEVEKTQIVEPTKISVTDTVRYDRLVLSACHPLYSAAQRLIVFARLDRTEPV